MRAARRNQDAALRRIDALTWTSEISPAPAPAHASPFFGPGTAVENVLAVELDGEIAGYVELGSVLALRSAAHVLEIKGAAVDPACQRRGLGRQFVTAAIEVARDHGAKRLLLRGLGSNIRARALYESCGFEIEGILRGVFLLEGRYWTTYSWR